jgi:hypothetical protein
MTSNPSTAFHHLSPKIDLKTVIHEAISKLRNKFPITGQVELWELYLHLLEDGAEHFISCQQST